MTVEFRSDVTVELDDVMGSDEKIARVARVSTKGAATQWAQSGGDVGRFLRFLWREGHTTPFRHTGLTFLVTAPIFVWEQHRTHKVGVEVNSESARYRELEPVFYLPANGRPLAQVGKQASYELVQHGDPWVEKMARNALGTNAEDCWEIYQSLLNAGVAKEVARMALPVSIYRSAYVTFNVQSLLHFLNLRGEGTHAQDEIQMVASLYEHHLAKHFPLTYEAWLDE